MYDLKRGHLNSRISLEEFEKVFTYHVELIFLGFLKTDYDSQWKFEQLLYCQYYVTCRLLFWVRWVQACT